MKKVLIVKNIIREGPGIIGLLLEEKGIPYEVVDLERGETFPLPKDYGAVIVLGGPDSANDISDKMKNELLRVGECLASGIPYLGICLGFQVLVKVAGGTVVQNPLKEIAFRDPEGEFFQVVLTHEGKWDPLLQGIKDYFNVFHLHGETVTLTGPMQLLGTGKFCRNQMARVGGKAYGLQFHLELTSEMLECWTREDFDLNRFDPKALGRDFRHLQEELDSSARTLFTNFFRIAGLSS